jgi:hypothetical protein
MLLRRFVGLLALLLATVGFLGCVAGTVAIWQIRGKATTKVEDIAAKAQSGLKRVSAANLRIKEALEKARADVAKVNKDSTHLASGDAEKQRLERDFLRVYIKQNVSPKVRDLGDQLGTVADAAAAVSSLLESFEELPLAQKGQFHPDKVKRLAELAGQLPGPLEKLQGVLGDGNKSSSADVSRAANDVDAVLKRCVDTVDDWQTDLDTASKEVTRIENESVTWLTYIAIIVTVVCTWMALGQLSLFAHGLKWCRRE